MIANVENGRLYLPAADPSKPNERTAMHPETNIEQVIVDASGTKLNEYLGPQMILSSDKPTVTNVLWLQITSTKTE